ncbi:MAG: hypothetical protein EZS28_042314 [Streblomastix strix]|uniref:Uncharacterized protein n=1 Tax=Streblomastix strix TaxID=222440 RepID=A0A5J4TWA7_9EUKA|nr:MAG: hypothetical protein EZS28_042314 [Streblomastix strix]
MIIRNNKVISIQVYSRAFLAQIRNNADEEGYQMLIMSNFVRALGYYTGNAGGNLNEEDLEVLYGLFGINTIFDQLYNGRVQTQFNAPLKPQPQLIPLSVEQIEEVGGFEEIESNLFKKAQNFIDVVNQLKVTIFRYFNDRSNLRGW